MGAAAHNHVVADQRCDLPSYILGSWLGYATAPVWPMHQTHLPMEVRAAAVGKAFHT